MASEATNIIERGQTAFVVKWVASIIQILGYAGTGFGWTPETSTYSSFGTIRRSC